MPSKNEERLSNAPPHAPIVATISAVIAGEAVLLVRRANPPDVGCWAFPGGKIEFGETIRQAALRELHEETSIRAEAGKIFTAVDVFDHDASGAPCRHYVLVGVLCRHLSGSIAAGSDVLEARWFHLSELDDAALAISFPVARVAYEAASWAKKTARNGS